MRLLLARIARIVVHPSGVAQLALLIEYVVVRRAQRSVPQRRTATYHPSMPPPTLQSHPHASREDLIRYYHKIELHWARHLGKEAALDVGTAISNPELNKVHDANRLCDAALPEGLS